MRLTALSDQDKQIAWQSKALVDRRRVHLLSKLQVITIRVGRIRPQTIQITDLTQTNIKITWLKPPLNNHQLQQDKKSEQ